MLVRRFVLLASSLLLIVAVPAAGDQVASIAVCNDNRTPGGTLTNGVLSVHLEASCRLGLR